MKTTRYLLSFALILCSMALTKAQNRQYIRYALDEINTGDKCIYRSVKGDLFEYTANNRSRRIKLILVSQKKITYSDIYTVRFPGKSATYQLVFEGELLTCTNPDGSRQSFHLEDKLVSKSKNGLIEYLYGRNVPPRFYYNNNRKTKKVELLYASRQDSEISMKFPGSNKIYKLKTLANGNVICTNPDGSKQTFVLQD